MEKYLTRVIVPLIILFVALPWLNIPSGTIANLQKDMHDLKTQDETFLGAFTDLAQEFIIQSREFEGQKIDVDRARNDIVYLDEELTKTKTQIKALEALFTIFSLEFQRYLEELEKTPDEPKKPKIAPPSTEIYWMTLKQ